MASPLPYRHNSLRDWEPFGNSQVVISLRTLMLRRGEVDFRSRYVLEREREKKIFLPYAPHNHPLPYRHNSLRDWEPFGTSQVVISWWTLMLRRGEVDFRSRYVFEREKEILSSVCTARCPLCAWNHFTCLQELYWLLNLIGNIYIWVKFIK